MNHKVTEITDPAVLQELKDKLVATAEAKKEKEEKLERERKANERKLERNRREKKALEKAKTKERKAQCNMWFCFDCHNFVPLKTLFLMSSIASNVCNIFLFVLLCSNSHCCNF